MDNNAAAAEKSTGVLVAIFWPPPKSVIQVPLSCALTRSTLGQGLCPELSRKPSRDRGLILCPPPVPASVQSETAAELRGFPVILSLGQKDREIPRGTHFGLRAVPRCMGTGWTTSCALLRNMPSSLCCKPAMLRDPVDRRPIHKVCVDRLLRPP